MSASKDKGRRLENWVAEQLRNNGIQAERVPLTGSYAGLDGKFLGDVVIGTFDQPIGMIECKNRESISKLLWEWLEGNQYLIVKRNKYKPLVVMTMEEFMELKK